jgi:hypothetical protein
MISIECIKGLPLQYESFLREKYDSYITTCRYVEVYYPTCEVHYMLVYENGILIDLLIFGNGGQISRCFNSLVVIEQNVIDACIKKVFEIYPTIKKVIIDASYKCYALRKSVLSFLSDNHILELPATLGEYYSRLGSSTRQTIKNRRVRLLRDYPDARFVAKFGNEIDEEIVAKIIQLNIERLKLKGRVPRIDNVYKENLYKYSQYYGFAVYLEIDGEIVAGNISTILNKGVFGRITAYNNSYSKYNVGELCAFYAIQTAIERGLASFHFLWGESDLKKRLLAKPHLLFSYIVYRTYSIGLIAGGLKALCLRVLKTISESKYSKPIINAIKFYHRRKFRQQLSR